MFTSLLSKKKRLIQRLWKMRRSCFCRDSSTKNLDESCEILCKFLAKYYPKNDWLLEKYDLKELFFDVLNHFTTENLEILLEELSSNDGKVCPCLTISDAEWSKKSKILSKKLSKLENLRLIKHLLFHFFVLNLKGTKNKVEDEKLNFTDRDQSCDTKNLQFMTLPWCSCDNGLNSICLNPFHVALSHSNNEKIMFNHVGETIESGETENDLHSIDYNDAIHES
uniref:Uncharacterized protein n=1 Tax=Romanomermis culicivorax TaxID=13658 RepID=A0A915KWP2_ROMCU